MLSSARTFRVFVSSTFEDLSEERDRLQQEVFPTLHELCLAHGCRFQAIDLRWGIGKEAAADQRTMELCLAEIERCQKTGVKPNFIVLLGDRYGWQPAPARIEADEFARILYHLAGDTRQAVVESWYQRDDNASPPEFLLKPRSGQFLTRAIWEPVEQAIRQTLLDGAIRAGLADDALVKYEASATHQEILKGLGAKGKNRDHTFAFLRTGGPAEIDPALHSLKQRLRRELGPNAFEYAPGEIGKLLGAVRERLERIMLEQIAHFESRSALDMEIDAHRDFAIHRAASFVGRQPVLRAIRDYLEGDDQRPMVISGAAGSGKSAVMAKASGSATSFRFVGATPESSVPATLLRGLCQEISRRYGQTESLLIDSNELAAAFRRCISLATAEKPLTIFIDGVDQLAPQGALTAAAWLPSELPRHCKIVVSALDLPVALERARVHRMEPFPEAEAGQLLKQRLEQAGRGLQPTQWDRVMAAFRGSPIPLYLKLAFEQARRWRSFDPLDDCVLEKSVTGIIEGFFRQLSRESNHGPVLVSRALGFLTASRSGLTLDEMVEILSSDDDVWSDFLSRAEHRSPPLRRLPTVVWSRLLLDLEPYLAERRADGTTVLSFFHRQLGQEANRLYLAGEAAVARHTKLQEYFRGLPLRNIKDGKEAPNLRKLSELPYQMAQADSWQLLDMLLADREFGSAKIEAGMLSDLLRNCGWSFRAPEAWRLLPASLTMRPVHRAVSEYRSFLAVYPHFAAHVLANALGEDPAGDLRTSPRPALARVAATWKGLVGGHIGPVLTAAFGSGPTESLVASGGMDTRVLLWRCPRLDRGGQSLRWTVRQGDKSTHEDLVTFRVESELGRHGGTVNAVAFSPRGNLLASVGGDGRLRLWDPESTELIGDAVAHDGAAFGLDWTDDNHLWTCGSDGRVVRWQVTPLRIEENRVLGAPLHGIRVCPSAGLIAVCGADGFVRTLGAASLDDRRAVRLGDRGLQAIDVSGDTGLALAHDGRVFLFSLSELIRIADFKGTNRNLCVRFPPENFAGHRDLFLTGCDDGSLRYWNTAAGDTSSPLWRFSPICSIAIRDDGSTVTGENSGRLTLWHPTADIRRNWTPHEILCAHVARNGSVLVTGKDDYQCPEGRPAFEMRSPANGRLRWEFTEAQETVRQLLVAPDGRTAVTVQQDSEEAPVLRIWRLDPPAMSQELRPRAERIVALADNPPVDRQWSPWFLYRTRAEGPFRLGTTFAGDEPVLNLPPLEEPVALAVSHLADDRRLAAVGTKAGRVCIFGGARFDHLNASFSVPGAVKALDFTDDGRCLAVGVSGESRWNPGARSGEALCMLSVHETGQGLMIAAAPLLHTPCLVRFLTSREIYAVDTVLGCWQFRLVGGEFAEESAGNTAAFKVGVTTPPSDAAVSLLHEAGLAYKDGTPSPKAEAYVRAALSLSPDYMDAHLLSAFVLSDGGKYQEALVHANVCLESGMKHRGLRLAMAKILKRLKRYEEAADVARAMLEDNPMDDDALAVRANNLGFLGRIPDAYALSRFALRINPSNPVAQGVAEQCRDLLGGALLDAIRPEAPPACLLCGKGLTGPAGAPWFCDEHLNWAAPPKAGPTGEIEDDE